MNKQKKDGNISWTDYTWNPIKGLCPVGCWYCFARRIYKRFKLSPELAHVQTRLPKKPCKIFVCSTIEIFHSDIPENWRDIIFEDIKNNPQHTFQILTKMPENIDRPMPDNVWLGVSIEKGNDEGWGKVYFLQEARAKIKFISFEPILGTLIATWTSNITDFDWFIFGKLTGHGEKYNPDKRWIKPIIDYLKGYKKPIFLKNNLKEIWGEKLIQEWPRGD